MRALLAAALLLPAQAAAPPAATITGKVTAVEGETQKKIRSSIRYVGQGIEKRKDPDPSPAVVLLEGVPPSKVQGKTAEIRQEGLEFRPRILVVQTGTTVKFPNGDDLFHSVFSFSKAKRLNLGRYPKGDSKEETFETRGRVDLFCDIHKHMRGFIHIVDNPHFALCKEDGTYSIAGVPPGKYTLVVWKEFFDEVRLPVEVKADGAKVDVSLAKLEERPAGRELVAGCCSAR